MSVRRGYLFGFRLGFLIAVFAGGQSTLRIDVESGLMWQCIFLIFLHDLESATIIAGIDCFAWLKGTPEALADRTDLDPWNSTADLPLHCLVLKTKAGTTVLITDV